MDYEEESGILYWAAYTTTGEMRIIDTTTGASTLVGGFLAALRSIPWPSLQVAVLMSLAIRRSRQWCSS
jgi:hypothetical protein